MAECFYPCQSGDLQGITKLELDRYTDKIDNLLSEENGRRLFRGFLITTERDGKKCLELWECCHNIIRLRKEHNLQHKIFDELLEDVGNVLEKSEEIEELNAAIIVQVSQSLKTKNEKKVLKALKSLKLHLTNIMRNDYNDFRKHILDVAKHL